MHFGSQNEAQKHSKIDICLIDFLEPPKTPGNHRGSSGGALRELRVGHFLPAGSPEAANLLKIIAYKQQEGMYIDSKEGTSHYLTRRGPLARRIFVANILPKSIRISKYVFCDS